MRLSRLQPLDLAQLLRLKYPVRCHACLERAHVSFARAWDIRVQAKWVSPSKSESNARTVQQSIRTTVNRRRAQAILDTHRFRAGEW
jgi:hypothetical protein